MRRHIDPYDMTKSSIYVILNHHGQECSGESSPCNRTRLIERMMNYAGFDFPYFLFPKHLIKMVMNFAGFKSEDILDNINDKNFSNFTMVSWMELVVQLYYLQLRKAPGGIQEKPLSLFWRWSDDFLLKNVGGCGQEEGHWRLELWPGIVPGL